MATVESKKDPSSPQQAPSPFIILFVYTVLGCLISFLTGREPGTLPDNIVRELAPSIIAITAFLVSYSLFDVMAVGMAKTRCNVFVSYKDLPTRMPEPVYLALRVQTNQIEQMPLFLIGTLACALLVNGTVAGILAMGWVVLRRLYASTYRNAVGVPFKEIGLGTYTIPAYFLVNSMVMAAGIHSLRCLLSG